MLKNQLEIFFFIDENKNTTSTNIEVDYKVSLSLLTRVF